MSLWGRFNLLIGSSSQGEHAALWIQPEHIFNVRVGDLAKSDGGMPWSNMDFLWLSITFWGCKFNSTKVYQTPSSMCWCPSFWAFMKKLVISRQACVMLFIVVEGWAGYVNVHFNFVNDHCKFEFAFQQRSEGVTINFQYGWACRKAFQPLSSSVSSSQRLKCHEIKGHQCHYILIIFT